MAAAHEPGGDLASLCFPGIALLGGMANDSQQAEEASRRTLEHLATEFVDGYGTLENLAPLRKVVHWFAHPRPLRESRSAVTSALLKICEHTLSLLIVAASSRPGDGHSRPTTVVDMSSPEGLRCTLDSLLQVVWIAQQLLHEYEVSPASSLEYVRRRMFASVCVAVACRQLVATLTDATNTVHRTSAPGVAVDTRRQLLRQRVDDVAREFGCVRCVRKYMQYHANEAMQLLRHRHRETGERINGQPVYWTWLRELKECLAPHTDASPGAVALLVPCSRCPLPTCAAPAVSMSFAWPSILPPSVAHTISERYGSTAQLQRAVTGESVYSVVLGVDPRAPRAVSPGVLTSKLADPLPAKLSHAGNFVVLPRAASRHASPAVSIGNTGSQDSEGMAWMAGLPPPEHMPRLAVSLSSPSSSPPLLAEHDAEFSAANHESAFADDMEVVSRSTQISSHASSDTASSRGIVPDEPRPRSATTSTPRPPPPAPPGVRAPSCPALGGSSGPPSGPVEHALRDTARITAAASRQPYDAAQSSAAAPASSSAFVQLAVASGTLSPWSEPEAGLEAEVGLDHSAYTPAQRGRRVLAAVREPETRQRTHVVQRTEATLPDSPPELFQFPQLRSHEKHREPETLDADNAHAFSSRKRRRDAVGSPGAAGFDGAGDYASRIAWTEAVGPPLAAQNACEHKPPGVDARRIGSKDGEVRRWIEKLQSWTADDLRAVLKANYMKASGKKQELVERAADAIVYGCLPRCPRCHAGFLRFAGRHASPDATYFCPGAFDSGSKVECGYESSTVPQYKWKWS